MNVKQFQMQLFGVNTYIIWDEESRKCAIIDPGMVNDSERRQIDSFISANNLEVTHLINTHLHIDHVFSDSYIVDRYNVKLTASKGDDFLLARVSDQADMFGLSTKPGGVEITENINDGDIIRIGSSELRAMHIPGHSPGSMVLYDEKDNFVITGDVLFSGSVGRADLPGGNFQQLIDGIKRKLLPLPDSTIVYPGHGPTTTIGAEKRSNPFLI